MSGDAWLGIDLGTQSARACVLDDTGAVLGTAAEALTSIRYGDRHEQDPSEWIGAVGRAVRGALAAAPSGTRIRALAVDGTSGTVVPVDAAGRATGPAAMYDDRRGTARLPEVEAAGGEVWARLGYRMQATWALPKVLTLLAEGAAHVGHQTDVVTSWLAGRRVAVDLSNALKTGADLDAVAWPEDVLDLLRIPPGALPRVVESGSVLGEVTADAADATGLPVGCPIVAGATDGVAAQLAAGALAAGEASSVLGTTLVLKGVAAERTADPRGAVYAHRAPFGGGWYPGGASSTGAGAVRALLPDRDLDRVTREAAALPGIPVAYPLIGRGERFPIVSDRASAFWPFDPDRATDAELLRATAFGVAFLERLCLERMAELGADAHTVRASGGGVRNAWWTALRAAVCGRELRIPRHTESAAGMALLAAAALGSSPGDLQATASRMLADGRSVAPLELDATEVEDAYSRFRDRLDAEEAA